MRPVPGSSSATPQWDVSLPGGDVYLVRPDVEERDCLPVCREPEAECAVVREHTSAGSRANQVRQQAPRMTNMMCLLVDSTSHDMYLLSVNRAHQISTERNSRGGARDYATIERALCQPLRFRQVVRSVIAHRGRGHDEPPQSGGDRTPQCRRRSRRILHPDPVGFRGRRRRWCWSGCGSGRRGGAGAGDGADAGCSELGASSGSVESAMAMDGHQLLLRAWSPVLVAKRREILLMVPPTSPASPCVTRGRRFLLTVIKRNQGSRRLCLADASSSSPCS